MTEFALSIGGKPDCGVDTVENGTVVADASLTEMHDSHRQTIQEQVELGAFAEEIGFEYVHIPELHFALQGTLSPNPVLTLMAIAERTGNLELLGAVVPEWHRPVRLAERTAMLDIVSDGRAHIGLTKGSELGKSHILNQYFGQHLGELPLDTSKSDAISAEYFEILLRAWTEPTVSFDGTFESVPTAAVAKSEADTSYVKSYLRNKTEVEEGEYIETEDDGTQWKSSLLVAPQPVQEPHPPLWTVVNKPEHAEWAASRGINGMGHARSFERFAKLVDIYWAAAETGDWPDRRDSVDSFQRGWDSDCGRGMMATFHVFNTDIEDESTVQTWREGQEFVVENVFRHRTESTGSTVPDLDEVLTKWDSPIVGSTAEIVSELERLKQLSDCEDLLLAPSFDTHGLSTTTKRNQMRHFSKEIMPQL